ncbi:histidinol-phosphatase [Dermacoccaceae bacterium W4C1]
MPSYDDDLRLAHVLADAVEPVTTARFGSLDLKVDTKPDLTPVTDADRDAEQALRHQLKRTRPRDAVLGEEFGLEGEAERQWVLDPIDGTKNFVRGVPVWATLISLVVAGTPVLGVVAAPALNRRWWAAGGSGAYTGRSLTSARRISVSQVSKLEDASVSFGDIEDFAAIDRADQARALADSCWRARGYGDFWSHMLVAEGAVDLAPEAELAVHDMAALAPIVTESGGRFTGLDGRDGIHSGNALSSNGILHDAALEFLG